MARAYPPIKPEVCSCFFWTEEIFQQTRLDYRRLKMSHPEGSNAQNRQKLLWMSSRWERQHLPSNALFSIHQSKHDQIPSNSNVSLSWAMRVWLAHLHKWSPCLTGPKPRNKVLNRSWNQNYNSICRVRLLVFQRCYDSCRNICLMKFATVPLLTIYFIISRNCLGRITMRPQTWQRQPCHCAH